VSSFSNDDVKSEDEVSPTLKSDPKILLKNYPTFDMLDERLYEFMSQVSGPLRNQILEGAEKTAVQLIYEIGT